MNESAWDVYVEGYRNSVASFANAAQDMVDEPGIVGRFGTQAQPDGRLLIWDDVAVEALRQAGDPRATLVLVHPRAEQCMDHMNGLNRYFREHATSMVARDLAELPEVELAGELTLTNASLTPGAGEVPLADATAAFLKADPVDDDTQPDDFAKYLASIPDATVLAAVDDNGEVRATAASAVFGGAARVFFVSKDPEWRGRGIGTAMTAAVLRSARDRGATHACLEASAAGRGIYGRLGFEDVGPIVLFSTFD